MAQAQTQPQNQQQEKSFFDKFKEYILLPIDRSLLQAAPELGHLAPVILSIGTAFVALISMNWPMAVFSASTIEALFLYNGSKLLSDLFVTPVIGIAQTEQTEEQKKACRSYFQTLTPARFRWFMEEGLKTTFPNQALYFISFAFSYILQSMLLFNKETSELGPQYSNRPYLAMIGGGMFIFLYAIYILAYGCDSIFTVFFSILIGLAVGILICFQNNLLFGKEGINLLFIPPLGKRSGMDYICVRKS